METQVNPDPQSKDEGTSPSKEGAFPVHAGSFDGPLDLLLHLVRTNEVDISDIPITQITDQYHEYLSLMRELNLEIAGEYLVMAATLMYIKSQMLLPPDPDSEGEEGIEDPRQALAQQLLDYQRFRSAAENLQAMESRRTLIWTREDVPEEFADEELLAVDMFDLLKAFRKLLGRLDQEHRLQLKRDNVSVADKVTWLTEQLRERGSLDLLVLFEELPTRLERIATFLAVLEMMKLTVIVVFQRKHFGEIRVALRPETAEPG